MNTFDDINNAELQRIIVGGANNQIDTHARLYKMIDYAKDRFHWYADQREKKVGLAIVMVTLSGVSLTLIVNSVVGKGIDPTSLQFRLICMIQLFLTMTAFGVVIIYLRGENLIYTHREGLNNIFSWYGYGVPSIKRPGLGEYFLFGRYSDLTLICKHDPNTEIKKKKVIEGYQQFSENVIPRLFECDLAIREDLQQVYILQIFQVIARDNLQTMISCLRMGGIAISLAIFILIGVMLICGVPVVQN